MEDLNPLILDSRKLLGTFPSIYRSRMSREENGGAAKLANKEGSKEDSIFYLSTPIFSRLFPSRDEAEYGTQELSLDVFSSAQTRLLLLRDV